MKIIELKQVIMGLFIACAMLCTQAFATNTIHHPHNLIHMAKGQRYIPLDVNRNRSC